jgi:hypothetical protein
MEADWEIEIGGDAAAIEAAWTSFVDLGQQPEQVTQLSEVQAFPPLGQSLVRLNSPASPVWTSKCDFWPQLEPSTWDADEMEAAPDQANCATGVYIDLLPRLPWTEISEADAHCRSLCAQLRTAELTGCRVDLIVRQAWTGKDTPSLGITAYLTACGATEPEAQTRLATCLQTFTSAILPPPARDAQPPDSTLQ